MEKKSGFILGLLALFGLGAVMIYAAASAGYSHDPSVIGKGGEIAAGASKTNLAVVDEGAIGYAQSPNYRAYTGFLYVLPHDALRVLSPPNPPVIGTGGSSSFQWVSDCTGTWTLDLVGGTANPIDSGNCTAGVPVTTTVLETDLQDDADNTLTLTVTCATNQASVNLNIIDDQTPPVFTQLDIATVTGKITDPSITQIIVTISGTDQTVPVTAGTFTFNCPAGTTEAIVKVGNFTKKIRIQN